MVNSYKQLLVYQTKHQASKKVAVEVCNLVEEMKLLNRSAVLGLATGSTPQIVYEYLIEEHERGRSFDNVVSFNLDEYFPIEKENRNSFYFHMYNQLFNHIDVPKQNIHIPHIDNSLFSIDSFCEAYEDQINKTGGIDLQILGIGENGHIAFNEPGSALNSVTRLVELDDVTRKNAADDFGSFDAVPKQAITMGIQSILKAKKIILLAFGENKSAIINRFLSEDVNPNMPASFLKKHGNCQIIIDKACAEGLKQTVFQDIINR